jgi:hypothetical protein
MDLCIIITKVSIAEQAYCSENLPSPLFSKEGECLPFVKGGGEGFNLQCLHNY